MNASRRPRRRLARAWVPLGLIAVLAVAACGGSSDSSSSGAPQGNAADGAAAAPVAEADAAAGGAGKTDTSGNGVLDASSAVASGRRIVTVDLSVETDDVSGAAGSARTFASREQGFVANESSVGGSDPSASMTLRVPLDRTDAVVAELAGLGKETSRSSSAQDVEAQLVDLESRVKTAEASIARLQALIADAKDLSDIILLEGELSQREADLNSLDAQRAALAGQAALSTVNVTFRTPAPLPGVAGGFLDGLRGGWRALRVSTGILLTILGAVLPFLVVIALFVVIIVAVARAVNRMRGRGLPPSSASPPAAPLPTGAAPYPTAATQGAVAPQPVAPQPVAPQPPAGGNVPPPAVG